MSVRLDRDAAKPYAPLLSSLGTLIIVRLLDHAALGAILELILAHEADPESDETKKKHKEEKPLKPKESKDAPKDEKREHNAKEKETVARFFREPPAEAKRETQRMTQQKLAQSEGKNSEAHHAEPHHAEMRNAEARSQEARPKVDAKLVVAMTQDPRAAVRHHLQAREEIKKAQAEAPAPKPEAARTTEQPKARITRFDLKQERAAQSEHPALPANETRSERARQRRSLELQANAQGQPSSPQPTARHDRGLDRGAHTGTTEADDPELKGGYAVADLERIEEIDTRPQGLREADALGDAHRCRAHLADGSRCLRTPPEGELYCRAHRQGPSI